MDVFHDREPLFAPGGIQKRQIFYGSGDGMDHKRQVGQRAAFSKRGDAGEVGFEKCRHMGRGTAAEHHAFCDGLPHLTEWNDLFLMEWWEKDWTLEPCPRFRRRG